MASIPDLSGYFLFTTTLLLLLNYFSILYQFFFIFTIFLFIALALLSTNLLISYWYYRSQTEREHEHYSSKQDCLRPLVFTSEPEWAAMQLRRSMERASSPKYLTLSGFPSIEKAIDQLISYVIRDFIRSWYEKISPETVMIKAITRMLYEAVGVFSTRVESIDVASVVIGKIVPVITTHVHEFRKAEMAVRGSFERNLTESDELDALIVKHYNKGRLHPAVQPNSSGRSTKDKYLRKVVERLLDLLFSERSMSSSIQRVLIREVLACTILQSTMEVLSDPDLWNRIIDTNTTYLIREQKMVNKLRAALNKQAAHEETSSQIHTFEEFLRMIKECSNLLDIKRIRNEIVTQIRKKRMAITGREKDEIVQGQKVAEIKVYINRLYVAKRQAEKRIMALGGVAYSQPQSRSSIYIENDSLNIDSPTPPVLTLSMMLSSSTGLSYWMEHMDRTGGMLRLQFWLMVEGLKEDMTSLRNTSNGQEERLTAREDVRRIYDMYFSENLVQPLEISPRLLEKIQNLVFEIPHNNTTNGYEYILQAQKEVFNQMEMSDFPRFRESDLYFKFLASLGNSTLEPEVIQQEYQPDPFSTPKRAPGGILNRSRTDSLVPFSPIENDNWSVASSYQPSSLLKSPRSTPGSSQRIPMQQELFETPSTPGLQITFKEDDLLRTDAIEAVEAALSTIMDTGDISESEETRISKGKNQAVQFAEHPNSDSERDSNDSSEETPAQEADDNTSIANNVHLAPPGDLMLSDEISRLTEEIDKINQQEAIVDTLIKKAETSGKMDELRILKKSKHALRREMQETTYQKTQYELQEAENSILPGRTTVNITGCTISNDGTKDFVLYVIEVHQKASDGTYASGWVVTRRYSEFYNLHNLLKARFPEVRRYEFPGKRVGFQFHKSFVEFRRVALEKYLQLLVKNHDVCKTQEFKTFFCQQNLSLTNRSSNEMLHSRLRRKRSIGFMKHIYQTVAEGIDDMFNGQSTVDIVTQRLGQQVTMLNEASLEDPNNPTRLTNTSVVTVSGPDIGLQPIESEGITSLTEPLCDLFIEIFELKEKNNWLRRQAVVIVLQQILGGTIERKIKSTMKTTLTDDTMATWINMVSDSLWPNGEWPKAAEKRTFEEKIQTKETANRKLSTFFPESLGNMVGRENARRGARRVFTLFQNRRLNEHLVYTILDEVLMSLFPELKLPIRL
ncbi:hypothetical protein K493DRAFT_286165 [Basidiobolus meristosporus CBS 931.73]|uniref:Uncharacterized protein n=1 Tax=Basidiobolus meristosporus CBS 931.73 TaxID=1314790 RepID=A0A1Y1Y2S8_9FUNG|nr:hypothetical protein K493DRAFT_286165 [Basidiobolus meristosporus CBS 931.73]|eukprot:ORX92016.1 hypothetical protein K493DRAFT_286165 [Basidiobolus meristosporus CBS 931.73]